MGRRGRAPEGACGGRRPPTILGGVRRGGLVLGLAVSACVIAAGSAHPAPSNVHGPSGADPRGDVQRGDVLDIAAARANAAGGRVTLRLTTYDRWAPAVLSRGGEIAFYFDVDSDSRADRHLDVLRIGGRLTAVMLTDRGQIVGQGVARTRGSRTVVAEIADTLLGSETRTYRWFAFAGYRCDERYRACGDTAPARGRWIAARIPLPPPHPIAGQGYRLAFEDGFDRFDRSVWTDRQWWEQPPPANSVYVRDGALWVVSRRTQGYPNVTASSEPHGSAKGKSFKYGYFEARLAWNKGPGTSPAFWLFSTTHATNTHWPSPACPGPECLAAELDVVELYGNHPDVFTGTLHRNSCNCYGVQDQQSSNSWHPQPLGTDLSSDYHTYAALWTPTEVRWYLDGVLQMTATPYDSFNQRLHLLLYNWRGAWESGNQIGSSSPSDFYTKVDWVRVWQK